MKLAKPHIDIGLATNRLEEMQAFYQDELGVPFDHMLPVREGLRQYRHDLMGSVLKINHQKDGTPETPPSGYRTLLIARESLAEPYACQDPDGNRILIVPDGWNGITRVGIELAVRDAAAHARFYGEALGLPRNPDGGFFCGDSVIRFREDASAPSDATREGTGFRYITIQVEKVDTAHEAALAGGAAEGMAPLTLGEIARISFVRDPDGNWIELSQRKSITGSLD